jgi:hypothetical protein
MYRECTTCFGVIMDYFLYHLRRSNDLSENDYQPVKSESSSSSVNDIENQLSSDDNVLIRIRDVACDDWVVYS